jgi:hypothetical protein
MICSGAQKIWASSYWNLLTLVNPDKAPEISFLCSTPKSAILKGSSLYDLIVESNIKQCPGQFIGFIPKP